MTAPLDPWVAWALVAGALAWCGGPAAADLYDRLKNRKKGNR